MNRLVSHFPVLLGLAAILAVAGSSPAGAVVLAPGDGPFAPDVFATAPTGTVLAILGPTPFATPGGDAGTLLTAVVQDTPGGTLDFLYQWTANAANQDNFVAVSAISYNSFGTDVGYITPGAALTPALLAAGFTVPGAAIATPTSVQRSVSGNTVDWFFPGLNFLAGDTSTILMVKTSALFYQPGVAGIQDGTTANVPAFAPSVPEPMSLLVWGGMGIAIVIARSWARRRQ